MHSTRLSTDSQIIFDLKNIWKGASAKVRVMFFVLSVSVSAKIIFVMIDEKHFFLESKAIPTDKWSQQNSKGLLDRI